MVESFPGSLSTTSIEAVQEPVKFFEGIGREAATSAATAPNNAFVYETNGGA